MKLQIARGPGRGERLRVTGIRLSVALLLDQDRSYLAERRSHLAVATELAVDVESALGSLQGFGQPP